MRWQDWALASASIVFIIALVPTLRDRTQKPALSTSVTTGVVLGMTAFVYLTLSLWFATVTTALSSATWLLLAVQRYLLDR
jgi:hypothetical protein